MCYGVYFTSSNMGKSTNRPVSLGLSYESETNKMMAALNSDSTLRFNDGSYDWDSGSHVSDSDGYFSLEKDGSTYTARQNGVQVAYVDRGTESQRSNGVLVGDGFEDTAAEYRMRFYCAVFVGRILTTQELSDLETYVAAKVGL